jgi:hypothetical protein
VREVEPSSIIARCLIYNLADTLREILFHRAVRDAIIEDAQRKAVGKCLVDRPGELYGMGSTIGPNSPESFEWHSNPDRREEINDELEQKGFTKSHVLAIANEAFAGPVRKIEQTLAPLHARMLKLERELRTYSQKDAKMARKAATPLLDTTMRRS